MKSSRYLVGVDLGTSHCSVTYLDTFEPTGLLRVFPLKQWESDSSQVVKEELPSFCYFPRKREVAKNDYALGSDYFSKSQKTPYVVGRYAKALSYQAPERVASSAKSWLCHGGVDRKSPILPWQSEELLGSKGFSPVEVTSFLLAHIRFLWDQEMASHEELYKLEHQKLVITVPASFDEVASRLTMEAAKEAGLNWDHIKLVEEPQAAFYTWLLNPQARNLEPQVYDFSVENSLFQLKTLSQSSQSDSQVSKKILVCDIGGGTTDFSLFEVSGFQGARDPISQVRMKRLAVSDHILLGGDNIDLKIAHSLEEQFKEKTGRSLTSKQWASLIREASRLKETILSKAPSQAGESSTSTDQYFLTVAGESSRLLGDTVTLTVCGGQMRQMILEDFFPRVSANEKQIFQEVSGLRQWGLPYPRESAVTRHLRSFLQGQEVDGILYAGGSLCPQLIRNRLTEVVSSWQPGRTCEVLETRDLNLAISKGATLFAHCWQKKQLLMEGGYPRSVYLSVEALNLEGHKETHYLLILPKGTEYGSSYELSQSFQLTVGQMVSFDLFSSRTFHLEKAGDLREDKPDSSFVSLPPLQTQLSHPDEKKKSTQLLNVKLSVRLTHTGLLQLCFVSPDISQEGKPHRWDLKFNLQESSLTKEQGGNQPSEEKEGSNSAKRISQGSIEEASKEVIKVYGKKKKSLPVSLDLKPGLLIKSIENRVGAEKGHWDLYFLRSLWNFLKPYKHNKGRSEAHESVWLNLAGYALRPGCGDSLDLFRVQEAWKIFDQGTHHSKSQKVTSQWWIFWRRVAAGLGAQEQERLFAKAFPLVRQGDASPEIIMMLASLERLPTDRKVSYGYQLVQQIKGKKRWPQVDTKIWALARLGSRLPLYAGEETVVPPGLVEGWLQDLEDFVLKHPQKALRFKRMYLACGRTVGARHIDLSVEYRNHLVSLLEGFPGEKEELEVLYKVKPVDATWYANLFGEELPAGLRLNLYPQEPVDMSM